MSSKSPTSSSYLTPISLSFNDNPQVLKLFVDLGNIPVNNLSPISSIIHSKHISHPMVRRSTYPKLLSDQFCAINFEEDAPDTMTVPTTHSSALRSPH